jgi:hypothetical protein
MTYYKKTKFSLSERPIFINFQIQKSCCFWENGYSFKKTYFLKYSRIFFLFPELLETLQSKTLVVPIGFTSYYNNYKNMSIL